MTSIVQNVQDPSWWFNAFFIAIIASVVAGFLKDRISTWLSKIFTGLESWKRNRQARRKVIIEALLSDPLYFQMSMFRIVVGLLLTALTTIFYMSGPGLLLAAPRRAPWTFFDPEILVWYFYVPIMGIISTIITFTVFARFSVVIDATVEYRKRHNLPKLTS